MVTPLASQYSAQITTAATISGINSPARQAATTPTQISTRVAFRNDSNTVRSSMRRDARDSAKRARSEQNSSVNTFKPAGHAHVPSFRPLLSKSGG